MSYDLEEARRVNGTFGDKLFPAAEISNFGAAPSAEVRAQSSRDELILRCQEFGADYQPLVDDFDREHHGDEDGARVAALAVSEGIVGTGSFSGAEGQWTTHAVVLARTDADGIVRTIGVPFTTGDGEYPTTAQVLDSLLSDSAGLNGVDNINEWANQYGYDLELEGPLVRETYENAINQAAELHDFLGEKHDMYVWGE